MKGVGENLGKWCEGKPLMLAALARDVALSVTEIAEYLGRLRMRWIRSL